MNNSFKVKTEKWKIVGILFWLALGLAARAQAPSRWHFLIEPSFMRPEVSFPISGAQRTVLVPSYLDDQNQPVYFNKQQFEALGVKFDAFLKQSLSNATDKKVTAEFARNGRQVIKYATLHSENPLTATMVLSPDFLKMFSDVFGDKFLVALPNRFTVYVFPKLASDYKNYAEMVRSDYKDSAYPVSLEVFEVSARGLKAIGTYEAP